MPLGNFPFRLDFVPEDRATIPDLQLPPPRRACPSCNIVNIHKKPRLSVILQLDHGLAEYCLHQAEAFD